MARAATTEEKSIMRTKGQWSALKLAVFVPHTIYTARLDTVPASTDEVAEITFVSGSGTLADVLPDMTLYIGTTAGAYDLGTVRIRKEPIAGTFYIGEQSAIDWNTVVSGGIYLTVVDDFNIFARHIRVDGTTPVMDYDIPYSDQHLDFNPVPVLGPVVRVAKLTGISIDVQLGSETNIESWVFDSTISTYAWVCDGATFDDDTIARPVATFTAVGWHLVYCTVTAANGKSRQGVRYVYIYDDDNPPAQVFQINSWDEDYDNGGVNFGVTILEGAGLAQIPDRALCVLFSEDHYDSYATGYNGSVGPIAGAENIDAIGRIISESIRYDAEKSEVSFDIYGYQEWMKRIGVFPVGLEIAVNTPAAWTDMPALSVARYLWHILEWRSTVTRIMDVVLEDDPRYAKELQSLSSNLWAQMEEGANETIFANLAVDSYGRFFAQIDPQLVPEAERDWVTVMDLTKADYHSGVEVERVIVPDVGLVDLSGVSIDISGHALAYFSLSPGHVVANHGEIRVSDKLLLTDQAQANQLAGLILGMTTNPYKPISLNLFNNKMISCFPRQFIEFTISANDSIRGIEETVNLIPRRRRMEYNRSNGFKMYSIECEAETLEKISINGDIPGSEDSSIPPLPPFPSIPPLSFTLPGDTSSVPDGPPVVIILDGTKGILYTTNFNLDASKIIWQFWNAGIPAAEVPYIADLMITPSGSVWAVVIPPGDFTITSGGGIYFASSIGAIFQKLVGWDWLKANYPASTWDSPGGVRFIAGVGYNPNALEEIAFVAGGNNFGAFNADVNFWIGNRNGFVKRAACTNVNAHYGSLTYGGGKWVLLNEQFTFIGIWDTRLWQFSADGSSVTYEAALDGGGGAIIHSSQRIGTSAGFYMWGGSNFKFWSSPDNGNTMTDVGDDKEEGEKFGYACDPTGQYVMGVWDTGLRGVSSDFGYTWGGLAALPYGGKYCFAYCGGATTATRWIAARGIVRYSNDLGNTWINKEGNLLYLIPVGMSIIRILIPGFIN